MVSKLSASSKDPLAIQRSSKMEQSKLQAVAHQHLLDDEDFGEGETEDTGVVNEAGSLAAAQAMATPIHHKSNSLAINKEHSRQSESKSNRSRTSRRSHHHHGADRSASKQSQHKIPPFQSPYSKQLLETYPQRTRWEIPDSKIVFSSQFCSGNMSRAARGFQKNCFDIWVACDAAPHMEGEYYKTWFYFSVTGVPQGEMLTFTFKNLSNQVSA